MKKLESQLKSVAKSLATLSKQVEKASKQIGKLETAKAAPAKKTTARKTSPKKKTAAKKTTAKKTVTKKTAAKKAPAKKTGVLSSVYGIISRSKKGVNVVTLKSKTGFESKQISNALYKLTKRGQIIFGAGCGALIFIIRTWTGYPEGAGFAVLLMNSLTPLIDHYIKPRIYGRTRKGDPIQYNVDKETSNG